MSVGKVVHQLEAGIVTIGTANGVCELDLESNHQLKNSIFNGQSLKDQKFC
jgi:hypothetical protein